MWSYPVRIRGDMTPAGQLITAVVQCGEELCAKSTGGCLIAQTGLVLFEAEVPTLETLTPMFPAPKAEA